MTDTPDPAVVTALLASRQALSCEAEPEDEERTLELIATAITAPASDAHLILLLRADAAAGREWRSLAPVYVCV